MHLVFQTLETGETCQSNKKCHQLFKVHANMPKDFSCKKVCPQETTGCFWKYLWDMCKRF